MSLVFFVAFLVACASLAAAEGTRRTFPRIGTRSINLSKFSGIPLFRTGFTGKFAGGPSPADIIKARLAKDGNGPGVQNALGRDFTVLGADGNGPNNGKAGSRVVLRFAKDDAFGRFVVDSTPVPSISSAILKTANAADGSADVAWFRMAFLGGFSYVDTTNDGVSNDDTGFGYAPFSGGSNWDFGVTSEDFVDENDAALNGKTYTATASKSFTVEGDSIDVALTAVVSTTPRVIDLTVPQGKSATSRKTSVVSSPSSIETTFSISSILPDGTKSFGCLVAIQSNRLKSFGNSSDPEDSTEYPAVTSDATTDEESVNPDDTFKNRLASRFSKTFDCNYEDGSVAVGNIVRTKFARTVDFSKVGLTDPVKVAALKGGLGQLRAGLKQAEARADMVLAFVSFVCPERSKLVGITWDPSADALAPADDAPNFPSVAEETTPSGGAVSATTGAPGATTGGAANAPTTGGSGNVQASKTSSAIQLVASGLAILLSVLLF